MIPVTVSLGLINLNAVIGTFIASALIDPTIAPTAIDRAFRIYMLPQGMFSVAVATVLFPTLSRLVARADMVGFRATVAEGLRQIAFLLVPASVFCAVLAEPLVRIIYQRGEFTPDQTPIVAGALAAFSLGLTFNGMMLLLNRAFFGLQLPRIPTIVAGANLVLNTALYLVLYPVGVWGVPLAISIANIAGAAALLILLQRRVGGLELRRTTDAFLRITAASAALGAVSYAVWWVLDDVFGRSFLAQVVSVGGAVTLGGLVYLGACRALGVREMQTLLSLRARFRRS
jgi:putative peptidoglycan lipid II flippase